ncbi:class I SAM-dependent methyltransferase [Saccharospirillum mangrovi]|uniref:class I SAM-dependent methyltransferase n=1 Tax=Saccharospirillum mangrovi TaxID=2161747 RepID=UPI0013003ACE|nr:class I SAM-dependent methyltransferase [Saccharospirillum mangrovi]
MTTPQADNQSVDNEQRTSLNGRLVRGDQSYDVTLRYASQYSLWLRFVDAPAENPVGVYDHLTLNAETLTIETGRCEILPPAHDQADFRLVALENIHDFKKLLFDGRVDVLDNTARNLPLVLSYKDNIDPAFREHVADIAYDLSIYHNLFDRLDEEYAGEPPEVAERIQAGILASLGPQLHACIDEHIQRLESLIAGFDGEQHSHHGYYLRKLIWGDLLTAPFIARTNLKPRGYIGDSEMMAMCYRNTYEGDSTFGKLLHKHPVSAPGAQAVRNRREIIPQLIRTQLARWPASVEAPFKFLSVACGPARELADMYVDPQDVERIHASLLDQDPAALYEAGKTVESIEAQLDGKLSVDFIRESVRTLLSTRELKERWGDFHFIYSMGLFDYLTPPVASAVLRKLYALLLPGGEMAIGNFHECNPSRYYMDYWLDWPIIYRTEESFTALAEGLKGAETWIEFDDTGVQMMLRIRKRES